MHAVAEVECERKGSVKGKGGVLKEREEASVFESESEREKTRLWKAVVLDRDSKWLPKRYFGNLCDFSWVITVIGDYFWNAVDRCQVCYYFCNVQDSSTQGRIVPCHIQLLNVPVDVNVDEKPFINYFSVMF